MTCKKCGYKNNKTSNFCSNCGIKLNEICNCWIKKEPYNCGEKECPSYGLYKKLLKKEVKNDGKKRTRRTY